MSSNEFARKYLRHLSGNRTDSTAHGVEVVTGRNGPVLRFGSDWTQPTDAPREADTRAQLFKELEAQKRVRSGALKGS